MKISIIDTGYVGLVTGVCLADFGNNIIWLLPKKYPYFTDNTK